MRKPTSGTQLAVFLFVDSRWHEPHDAVQCRAHGSTFEFLFEFQAVRASNRSTIEGPLYIIPKISHNLNKVIPPTTQLHHLQSVECH